MAVIERYAVRALIVSPANRLLMAHMHLPDRVFWCTPGGGIEAGEGLEEALHRELAEEVGERDWHIAGEVWSRTHRFTVEGEDYLQHERYLLVRSAHFEPPAKMNDAEEQQYFGFYRWWHGDEILASDERFEPAGIADILAGITD